MGRCAKSRHFMPAQSANGAGLSIHPGCINQNHRLWGYAPEQTGKIFGRLICGDENQPVMEKRGGISADHLLFNPCLPERLCQCFYELRSNSIVTVQGIPDAQ